MAMQLDSGTGGIRAPSKPKPKPAKKPVNQWAGEDVAPVPSSKSNSSYYNSQNQKAWAGESIPTVPSSRPMASTINPGGYGKGWQGENVAPVPSSHDPSDPFNWKGIAAGLAAAAADRVTAPPPAPTPVYTSTGSGRSRSSGGGGGGEAAIAPAAAMVSQSIEAPPAAVQPPSIVANAGASEVNVPGQSFTSMGSPGSFGAYERRRANRGPRTGMSVTPEMIRRAAASRMG